MAVLKQIWLFEITGGMLLMCQNTTMRVYGALIKRYCVLCSKTCNTLHSCHNFPAGSQQAARGARICETSLLPLYQTEEYKYIINRPTTFKKATIVFICLKICFICEDKTVIDSSFKYFCKHWQHIHPTMILTFNSWIHVNADLPPKCLGSPYVQLCNSMQPWWHQVVHIDIPL